MLLSLIALAYFLFPYDFFPDLFIGWGWIDDIILLGLLWWLYRSYKKRRLGYGYQYQGEQKSHSRGAKDGGYSGAQEVNPRQKNPYVVLGIESNASDDDIRQAYRRLANQYHPDKVTHLGEEFRELAERRFKEIKEAYEKLMVK